jgi:hypothetical protein
MSSQSSHLLRKRRVFNAKVDNIDPIRIANLLGDLVDGSALNRVNMARARSYGKKRKDARTAPNIEHNLIPKIICVLLDRPAVHQCAWSVVNHVKVNSCVAGVGTRVNLIVDIKAHNA